MEIIKEVIWKVWKKEKLHLEHQGGKNVLIARKDDGSICIAFSDKKILKINQFLEVQDLIRLMYSWGKISSEKILEMEVPPSPAAEAINTGAASGEKALTEEELNKILDQREIKMQENFENKMEEIKNKLEEYQNNSEGYKTQIVSSLDMLSQKLEKVLRVKGDDEYTSERSTGERSDKQKPRIKNVEIVCPPNQEEEEFPSEEAEQMDLSEGNENYAHPKWVPIQGAIVSSTKEQVNEPLEDGEIEDGEYVEDWDQPEEIRCIRKDTSRSVSNFKRNLYDTFKNITNLQRVSTPIAGKSVNLEHLDLDKLIDQRVQTILKEKENESRNSIVDLSEQIQVKINEKTTGVNRQYKLTSDMKFEMFDVYLKSELKTKRLEYVLDDEKVQNISEEKLNNDKHKVKDIIINHIEMKYFSKILEIKEPKEILKKLKEYKNLEISVSSADAKCELYNLKYNPRRGSKSEFWDKFEGKLRMYENLPESEKLTDKEKKDIFMKAIKQTVSGANVFSNVHKQMTGNDITFEGLKHFFLNSQDEPTFNTRQHEPSKIATVASRGGRVRGMRSRGWYLCGQVGHLSGDCPTLARDSCYVCRQLGHKASNCPNRKRKEASETKSFAKKFKAEYDRINAKDSRRNG